MTHGEKLRALLPKEMVLPDGGFMIPEENKQRINKILDLIIQDCSLDVNNFEGREFSGKTLGELHGILEAKIEALAKIIKEII